MATQNQVSDQALLTTSNVTFRNSKEAYATTATADATTTLTVASNQVQYFTGVTTQICLLPVTSTLSTGFYYLIYNNSTGNVTVNASDSSLVVTMTPNTAVKVSCTNTGVTSNAAWDSQYILNSLAPTQANLNQSLTNASLLNTPISAISYRSLMANNTFYPNLLSAILISNSVVGPGTIDTGNIGIIENSFTPSWGTTTSISLTNVIALLGVLTLNTPGLTTFTAANVVFASGTITLTNTALTTFSMPSLATMGSGFTFTSSTSLTTINLPSLVNMFAAISGTLNALTTLTLTSLNAIGAVGTIPVAFGYTLTANALTTLSMPALTVIGGPFTPVGTLLATVSMPLLTTVGGAFSPTLAALTSLTLTNLATITGAFAPTFATLTTLALPALATCSAGFAPVCALATTVTLTSLATVTGSVAASFAALTTLSMPAIISVSTTFTITAANMVTFSLGSTLKAIGGNFTMSGMKLDQASVDGILVSLAALDGTGGTTAYSSHTVALNGGTNATPSATGLAAKATLVGRSCTVNTN